MTIPQPAASFVHICQEEQLRVTSIKRWKLARMTLSLPLGSSAPASRSYAAHRLRYGSKRTSNSSGAGALLTMPLSLRAKIISILTKSSSISSSSYSCARGCSSNSITRPNSSSQMFASASSAPSDSRLPSPHAPIDRSSSHWEAVLSQGKKPTRSAPGGLHLVFHGGHGIGHLVEDGLQGFQIGVDRFQILVARLP